MPEFELERAERKQPLAVLPRRRKDEYGVPVTPTVILDLEFAKGVAGCSICDKPIPKGTTRLKLNVRLDRPVVSEKGVTRTHEAFYVHPGCITDRIKPEVIRHGFDCYDCGAIPEVGSRWANYGFAVSRFSPAPLCPRCTEKPKWERCQVCMLFYPPWMLQRVSGEQPEPAGQAYTSPAPTVSGSSVAFLAPMDFVAPDAERTCEYCAARHGIRTVEAVESEAEKFERLRREIQEHGFYEAGSDGDR